MGKVTLSFLLMAALCSGASVIEKKVVCPLWRMTWTQARLYCQTHYIDLVTWNTVDRLWLAVLLLDTWSIEDNVWIGLRRDPENSSFWKWINVQTGEGITGDDVSQSNKKSGLCAFALDYLWYSAECSSTHSFYCSSGNNIAYRTTPSNWSHASQFCQTLGMELPTITKPNNFFKDGWIGLRQEAGETWSWVGEPSNYTNWAPQEPLSGDCASFDAVTKQWHSSLCSQKLQPICDTDNLVVVNENKTWEDALRHCRDMDQCGDSCIYQHNLLSLDLSSYSYVRGRIFRAATTDEVWTGLRFLGGEWFWVDGQTLEHGGKLPDCPSQRRHCGTLSKSDTNNWITRDCSEKRSFICYRYKIYNYN